MPRILEPGQEPTVPTTIRASNEYIRAMNAVSLDLGYRYVADFTRETIDRVHGSAIRNKMEFFAANHDYDDSQVDTE